MPTMHLSVNRPHYPAALADEAREWIADCEWADLEPEEARELPGAVALAGVARHYSGGLSAFIADTRGA